MVSVATMNEAADKLLHFRNIILCEPPRLCSSLVVRFVYGFKVSSYRVVYRLCRIWFMAQVCVSVAICG